MKKKTECRLLGIIPVALTIIFIGSSMVPSNAVPALSEDISASNLVVRPKISITGNAALDAFCAANGTTGLSWASAHRISGYAIDAGGTGDCIYIASTNRYLIISNCSLTNTSSGSGVRINTCFNIKISGVNISNTYYGVYADYSDYNIIENCRITAQQRGIYMYQTDFNHVANNTIWANKSNAIMMDYGLYNNFTRNVLTSATMSVINFYDQSNYNLITKNYFNGSVRDDNQYATPPNYFNDTYNGNYYKDYTSKYPGAPTNGKVYFTPYLISGTNVRYDYRPLVSPFVYQENEHDPVLASGTVSPGAGTQATLFTFSVTYSDLDANEPMHVRCIVNGTVYMMTKQNPTNYNYLAGVAYTRSIYLQPGQYEYRFETMDAERAASTITYTGPTVTQSNSASPALSSGNVNPPGGPSGASYVFQVTYSDPDNNQPAWINVSVNGTGYPMSKVDPLDTNYMDGCLYSTTVILTTGTYSYIFSASDGITAATNGPHTGLVVSGLISHSRISINGNAALNAYFAGNGTDGTLANPHRFSYLYIDGGGTAGSGIALLNTNLHVVIEHCVIVNCSTAYPQGGIQFSSTRNVNVTNCVIEHNSISGIMVSSSVDITIEFTQITGLYNYGIRVDSSSNIVVKNCSVTMGGGYGVRFYGASANTVQGCTFHGAPLHVTNSAHQNKVLQNSFFNMNTPLYIQDSNFNNITGNTITDCGGSEGVVYLYNAHNTTIARNSITNLITASCAGIYIRNANGNIVRENVVRHNTYGIRFQYSARYNQVSKNRFADNTQNGLCDGSGINWLDDGLNGNYWSDYTSKHPSALNNGFVWETSYVLSPVSVDRYPLVAAGVYQQNVNAPCLTSGLVTPAAASMLVPFNFSVVYSDADNNRPVSIEAIVNGTRFTMQKTNPADVNYVDGCQYHVSVYLQPGMYSYRFSASDPGFTNTTSLLAGPNVSIVNDHAPVVAPESIYPRIPYGGTTTITFRVRYSDADNNEPVSVTIRIDGGAPHPMVRENPEDLNYTDGTIFYYKTILAAGAHSYVVDAWDASRSGTTGTINEPTVRANLAWDQINLNGKRIGCVTTHGEDNPITVYSDYITNHLVPRGAIVSQITVALTAVVLANFDMLWVDEYGSTIPAAQLDALLTWIEAGGRLLITGEYGGSAADSILGRLNITTYSNAVIGPTTSEFNLHPIISGVSAVYFGNIANYRLSLTNQPMAIPVVNVTGHCIVAAMALGNGAVVIIKDESVPLLLGNANNLKFLQNTLGWLAHVNDHAPQLTGGKVMPATGQQNTLLNFSVVYTDLDDNVPVSIIIVVDGVSYALDKVNTSDLNYKDGTTYQRLMYLQPGNRVYRFECADVEYSNVSINYTVNITLTNVAPPMLQAASVSPARGDILTMFTFNVTYRDNDNNMPAWMNVIIDGIVHAMQKIDPLDGNAMDGVLYQYSTTLPWGMHQYAFSCSDGIFTNESLLQVGPEVTPFTGATNVVLVSPSNGMVGFTGSHTFTWQSLDMGIGPMNYTLEISNTTDFAVILQDKGGIQENFGTTSTNVYISLPTGSYYWRVRPVVNGAHGNTTDIRSLNIIYNENAPVLVSGVSPVSGNQLTVFNFTAIYSDADNNAPTFMNVTINGTSRAMVKANPGDENYTDGCLYYHATLLQVGTCAFSFDSGDGKYPVSTGVNTSVIVTRVNDHAPSLVDPQVSPSSGTNATMFTFSVWYFDQDNNLPVHINITINGTGPGAGTFNMSKSVPTDTNATNGILYVYSTVVDWGMHAFIIRCHDDPRVADTGWLPGPEINPFSGLAASTTILFSDDFEDGSFGMDWTVTGTGGVSEATSNSGTHSAYHCANAGAVTSRVIDTSGCTSITVSFWVQKGGSFSDNPEQSTEDFFVEYLTRFGTWQQVAYYSALDPAETEYLVSGQVLPWDACHAGFRLRFRQEGGGGLGQDYWHFDDIIVASSPLYVLLSPLHGHVVFTGAPVFAWESLDLPSIPVNWTWQLSNDTTFSTVLLEAPGLPETPETSSVAPAITFPSGQYAWRVRPGCNGISHDWSDIVVFTLVFNENPPVLEGFVSPDPTNLTYVHNFTVTYTDADNNPPVFMNVTINGTSHAMVKVNATDTDYTDGCEYFLALALPEGFNHFSFEASDGKHHVATPLNTSLFVARINHHDPRLVDPLVSPGSGDDTTAFSFTVWYYDDDNNLPLWVNLTINGTGTFTLDPVDPLDTNALDGIFYRYVTTLGIGYYEFIFSCNDDSRLSDTGWILGPDVNPFHAPTLTNVSVSPGTGTNATIFTFLATYTDVDGDMPTHVEIVINSTGTFSMMKVDPGDMDATDGLAYRVELTLDWGYHAFQVQCGDGRFNVSSPVNLGPVVNPFDGYSGSFHLLSPVNESTRNLGITTFTWESLGLATTSAWFTWQLSSSATFATILDEIPGIPETTGTTSRQVNLQLPSGTYYWRVQPYHGPFSLEPSAPFVIVMQDLQPVASFSANATLTGAGDAVLFTFTGSDGDGPASFSWNFGDGTANATARHPVHVFSSTGNHTVILTVVDSDGDIDASTLTITVVSYPQLVQPSSQHVSFMQGAAGSFVLLLHDVSSGHGTFTLTLAGNVTAYTNVSWTNGISTPITVDTAVIGERTYTLSIRNGNNLTRTTTIVAFIDDYPVVTPGPPGVTVDTAKGAMFLNWTINDQLGAGTGSFILYRNGARVANGTWHAGEVLAVLVDLRIPDGAYNFTIHVRYPGDPGWHATDTVMVTVTSTGPQFLLILQEYWYILVAAGVAIAAGGSLAARKRLKVKKAAKTKAMEKRMPDVAPMHTLPAGKTPPKLADGMKASAPVPADTGQERKFSARDLGDLKATAEEVTAFKQAKICMVHKGPITGLIYVCPGCDSLYCMKCARVLKEGGQKCWACGAELLQEDAGAGEGQ